MRDVHLGRGAYVRARLALLAVIAEANDRSDGIYDAVDGSLIAQGAGGLPVFVGTMQYSTRTLISMIDEGEVVVEGGVDGPGSPSLSWLQLLGHGGVPGL